MRIECGKIGLLFVKILKSTTKEDELGWFHDSLVAKGTGNVEIIGVILGISVWFLGFFNLSFSILPLFTARITPPEEGIKVLWYFIDSFCINHNCRNSMQQR